MRLSKAMVDKWREFEVHLRSCQRMRISRLSKLVLSLSLFPCLRLLSPLFSFFPLLLDSFSYLFEDKKKKKKCPRWTPCLRTAFVWALWQVEGKPNGTAWERSKHLCEKVAGVPKGPDRITHQTCHLHFRIIKEPEGGRRSSEEAFAVRGWLRWWVAETRRSWASGTFLVQYVNSGNLI